MEGATTAYKPDSKKESNTSKIKGVLCALCHLLCLGCSEDHNLDTSTFPETACLSTLCDGLRWDASKQADFQKMLSKASKAIISSPSHDLKPRVCAFPTIPEKSGAGRRQHRACHLGPARIPPRHGPGSRWAGHGHPPRAAIRRGRSSLGIRNLIFGPCLHLPQRILPRRSVA